jgi:uncharacterized protein YdeI (YjbR/CyaY-like superfamily)
MSGSKPLATDLPTQPFVSAQAFEAFLEEHHASSPGVYVKLAKKTSGIPSITGPEVVELALCYGWIDGRANSIDHEWWTIRITPRRAKSIWSQKNVTSVGRLIKEGKMRPAGMKCVDDAKKDGRWDKAYAGPATIEVPVDFERALKTNGKANKKFETLNRTERYSVLFRVQTASENARQGVIDRLLEALQRGDIPGAEERAKYGKNKKTAPTKVERNAVTKKSKTARRDALSEEQEAPPSVKKTTGTPLAPRDVRRAGLRTRT